MTTPYRFIAQRLTGPDAGQVIHWEVPLTSPEITHDLSGPSGLSATITPKLRTMLADDGRRLLREWDTAIYPEADGEIRGGFILTRATLEDATWQAEGIGFAGYPQGLRYRGAPIKSTNIDPFDVVRDLWDQIQSFPNGDLGMVVDSKSSPVRLGTPEKVEVKAEDGSWVPVSFYGGTVPEGAETRKTDADPYTLNWWETHDIGSEIDSLVGETPFDYTEEHRWADDDSNTIEHRLRIHHPRAGRRRHDLRFAQDENIAQVVPVVVDGEDFANEVLVLGKGEGRKMRHANVARSDDRLRRTLVVARPAERNRGRLRAVGRRHLRAHKGLDEISEITVRDHPNAPLGSWQLGDEIRVDVDMGWADTSAWHRIRSVTVRPDSGNVATLALERADRE